MPALGPTASADPPKAASNRSESRRHDCLTAVAPDFDRFERSPCLGHRCGVFPHSRGNGSHPLPTRPGKLATIVLLAVLLASCAGTPRSQLSALDDGPTRRCAPTPCVSARRSPLCQTIIGQNRFLARTKQARRNQARRMIAMLQPFIARQGAALHSIGPPDTLSTSTSDAVGFVRGATGSGPCVPNLG